MVMLHILWLLATWSQGLHGLWLSNPELDGEVIYACQGSMVSLPWRYNLNSGDVITDIQWFYKGLSEEVIAVLTHGAFDAFPSFAGRVSLLGSAGISFGPVIPADSGNYTVQVTGSDANGHHFEQRQTVYIQISDHLLTQDGYLHVSQNPVPVLDTDAGTWAVELLCGVFTFLGDPPYFVQWVTPSGAVQNSSSYDNGYFNLPLTGEVEGGTYTCQVPRQDQNQSCVSGQGSAEAEASIVVDGVDVRLTLLEKQNQQLSQQLQQLSSEKQQLSQDLQHLSVENQQLKQQLNEQDRQIQILHHIPTSIRLVGGRNSREGRVEIMNAGSWGTICDDGWYSNNAKVVCRMLGLSTVGAVVNSSAAFGQGSGAILLDSVYCIGNETDIKFCKANEIGDNDCSHSEDVGVTCRS